MAVMAWLFAVSGMFVVFLLYLIGSTVLYGQGGLLEQAIPGMANNTDGVDVSARQATMDTVHIIWNLWPWIFIIGLIIYGVLSSTRREPVEYFQ